MKCNSGKKVSFTDNESEANRLGLTKTQSRQTTNTLELERNQKEQKKKKKISFHSMIRLSNNKFPFNHIINNSNC
jgi:hypothetical protein